MSLYLWFFVVFYIWMFGKVWVRNQDVRGQRAIAKSLETNTKILEAIAKRLGVPESELGITKKDEKKTEESHADTVSEEKAQ